MDSTPANVCIAFLIALFTIQVYYHFWSPKYPPGPWRLPILGSLIHFSTFHPWIKCTEWGKTYGIMNYCSTVCVLKFFSGDIVYLSGLGNSIIILNSLDAITDLLSKRGHLFSDRPVFTMAGELMGLDRVSLLFHCTVHVA
jgi:hypothetical protein